MSDSASPCPFCLRLTEGPLTAETPHAAAFPDGFPVSPGHLLVVPRRHVADLFELTSNEQTDLWRLVARMRDHLQQERRPDGLNVGANVGEAAGQTVPHAHVHVIPRFRGDVEDPRGGLRWVVPEKAVWWGE